MPTARNGSRALCEPLAIARNLFMAPRIGAAALNIPAGMSNGWPVGLQLDALPGHDSELLGVGIAVERVLGRIPVPPVPQRRET
jgi:indoleacetamide hydrolase